MLAPTMQLAKARRSRCRPEFEDRWSFPAGLKKPVVAQINGLAYGTGLVLALYCDIRFAAVEAMLTTGFSKRGLPAEQGAAYLLYQWLSRSRTADLLFSSRSVNGTEAERIGLMEFAMPAAELPAAFAAYAI